MPIQDRQWYRQQVSEREQYPDLTADAGNRNGGGDPDRGSGRPAEPNRGGGNFGRLLLVALVAAIIGGGAVYAGLQYLDSGTPKAATTLQATPTPTPLSTATPSPTPLSTTPPTPVPTPTKAEPKFTPTATAPPATTAPVTERQIVVNAFAVCDGQYSGSEQRFRSHAAELAINEGRQSLGDIRALIDRHCGGVYPEIVAGADNPVQEVGGQTVTERSTPAAIDATIVPPRTTPTPVATTTGAAVETGKSIASKHAEEKQYMLDLINEEREKAGLEPVSLGHNPAPQLHADAALTGCFSSHWGLDGLKPYMRYSLLGGYQSNGENGSGLDYCIKGTDGFAGLGSMRQEIRETMTGWMASPGHKRNILDKWHKRVSIGIAWNRYNKAMYQHFEGDYVEFQKLPAIEGGELSFWGRTRNGVRFRDPQDLGVQIYYDRPTHELTRGQVARTYCYDNGRQVAGLRQPLTGGYSWTTDEFTTAYRKCPDPYDVPNDAPAPQSYREAHEVWRQASLTPLSTSTIALPWVTAREWTSQGSNFRVRADVGDILAEHGDGVYTVMLWGKIDGQDVVISQYSIFHRVNPPSSYSAVTR